MTTEPKPRTAMPTVAGVLILVTEGLKLLGIAALFIASIFIMVPAALNDINALVIAPIFILPVLLLLAAAVIGGIFAIQRRYWGWALAGAIIATLPFSILGLAAVILLAISREEFR